MTVIILILCVIVVAALCALRVRQYRQWSHVPARRMDDLRCRLTGTIIALRLQRNGFQVPAGLALAGRTVLLEIQISASAFGQLFDPFVEMRYNGVVHRQYFERGARGQRLVDLSPLFHGAETTAHSQVHLWGAFLRWQNGARLRLFEPPTLVDASILVVAPHPDDAEIAAFGLYATHRSWVVTITAGERGGGTLPAEISRPERFRWAAWLRVADSLSVPQLGKVRQEHCVNLVYPDAALECMQREPARPFQLACEPQLPRFQLRSMNVRQEFRGDPECCWNNLVEELRHVLQLARPDVVVCPHPLLDTHPDHVLTTHAIEQALRASGQPAPLFLMYAVHQAAAPTYPFGPASAVSGVAPYTGPSWLADFVYSHPLAPQTRQGKYFAVESMHGVRGYQPSLKRRILGRFTGLGADPAGFLRRAPRPTEMYYAVTAQALPELLRQCARNHG
jgi:LmbE family N-acetylglucosaminyl deacetylase